MPRDQEALIDIFQAALRVIRFTEGVTQAELEVNEEKQAAILYQVTIIGEATKRLSKDFRSQHPEIPWKQMAGMRDIVTHHYDEVDPDVVWDVVQDDIPQLLTLLEPLVSS